MTTRMHAALDMLRRSRREDPTTDDGVLTSERSYYDAEIDVAYINFATAAALARAGYIRYGDFDPDGTALELVRNA